MPMSVVYTTINGRIVHENRGGVERLYMGDTNGNSIGLMDASGNVTDTFTYWPFGELQSHVGTSETPFMFGGILGCYTDSWGGIYMRAREYVPQLTRWLTVDEMWPWQLPYAYVNANPISFVDPPGMQGIFSGGLGCTPEQGISLYNGVNGIRTGLQHCKDCAQAIRKSWLPAPMHGANHPYSHCMACCVLTRVDGSTCAQTAQAGQNATTPSRVGSWQDRWGWCSTGVAIGRKPIKKGKSSQADCEAQCSGIYKTNPPQPFLPPFPYLPECNPA